LNFESQSHFEVKKTDMGSENTYFWSVYPMILER